MPTVVLIHGSWHGAWCWREVERSLRDCGHDLFVPTLSGCAERFHHAPEHVNLETHIRDIERLLFFEDIDNAVLVGHSYAGLILQGVSHIAAPRLSGLLYLDAYVAAPGQCGFDLWTAERALSARKTLEAGGIYREPLPPGALGISCKEKGKWVSERLTPHPLATYSTPISPSTPASDAIPRLYIHCNQGETVPLFEPIAEAVRQLEWPYREINAPHDAMLTHPKVVADEINKFVTQVAKD
jgi:pimeloyl-ACP methyl ester carboxylesterase